MTSKGTEITKIFSPSADYGAFLWRDLTGMFSNVYREMNFEHYDIKTLKY
jgi:hypothetical protein